MGLFLSLRVLGAMVRISVPTVVEFLTASMKRGDIDSPGSAGARGTPVEGVRSRIDDRARWFGHRVVTLLRIDLVVTGAEHVPLGRSQVYMSNHQSHLDIPVLYATLPSPTIRMLAKKELFQIPLWGQALRGAEFVEVDRLNHVRALESIERAEQLIRDGVSVYLAPEGTRSRNGRIGRLKKGGFHLAKKTGTPIVPVAIRGTIDIMPRGSVRMHAGKRVEVTIGEPIPVTNRDIDDLMAEVSAFLRRYVEGPPDSLPFSDPPR